MTLTEIDQHVLNGSFRCAIGVDWLLNTGFVERHPILFAVGCTGRREHKLHASRINSGLDEVQGATDIITPVATWVFHTIANLAQRRKVHHSNGLMFCEHLVQTSAIQQIAALKWTEFYGIFPASDQVIKGDRRITCRLERLACVRADITRATRHQNSSHMSCR